MKNIGKCIKHGIHLAATKRFDPFTALRGLLPAIFFTEINILPYLKKAALFTLVAVIIVSFIITSLPNTYL